MDSMNLNEAYASVYLEEDFDTLLDDISDEELSEIVEEVVTSTLEEGYEIEEIEECFGEILFDQVISEARVDMAARAARRKADMAASEKSAKAARKAGASVVAREKRAETRAKVKAAVKSGIDRAKAKSGEAVKKAKEAGREAKFKAVDKKVASYANKRNLHPAPGMAARSKDPEKRRGLRAKVAKDIASRVKDKVKSMKDKASKALSDAKGKAVKAASDVAVKAYNKGREVKQAASDAKNRAGATLNRQAVKAARATDKAEKGAKSALGKVARGIADKAGKAASRLGEEVDSFDIVLDYLITEGHAETEEAAIKIMVAMSDEWREGILDEAGRLHSSSAQQAGFKRIKDMESGGPGAGKVRSDDEIRKEKGGKEFLDRLAAAKKKMK